MISDRIKKLRELMALENIDAYIIPTADYHESEYVGEYFRERQFITGFTGSAGTAVITQDEACLWTDGRYFVQAEAQLLGSDIVLQKMGNEGVPTIEDYLFEHMQENGVLGFDGRVINYSFGKRILERLKGKHIRFSYSADLIDILWTDRPYISKEAVWILPEEYTGMSARDKISSIRETMKKADTDMHLLTTLDDIAWLLNIRGNDVACNPVVLSYLIIEPEKITLYIHEEVLDEKTEKYLCNLGVTISAYDDIYNDIKKIDGHRIMLENSKVNYSLYDELAKHNTLIDTINPEALKKAVKTKTEIDNERKAHIKDAVAVTKFIYWLKNNIGKEYIDEISASDYLYALRKEQNGFIELSFNTISAYGANAAMCHYSATKESNTKLEPRGLYLVDSGGQYMEGTTDITRTIVLGDITDEEREHFTLVAVSMLRLGDARFLYGCSGISLDYIARELFWRRGLNFNHGTGHGVGYLLNVHERPNSFRYKALALQDVSALEEGMITSDEPGIYIEGSHGIRTENLTVCRKAEKNEYGQFMCFEFLTYVPIDLDGIDISLMEDRDKKLLNDYHKQVYEKVSPYLDDEERKWLKEATREI